MAKRFEPHESDLDAVYRVLEEYPWLVPLLRRAHWYSRPEGGGGFHLDVDGLEARREGMRALADRHGSDLGGTPADTVVRARGRRGCVADAAVRGDKRTHT